MINCIFDYLLNISLKSIIQYGVPIISVIISVKTYLSNKKLIKENQKREKMNEVKKVFSTVADYKYGTNKIKIYNRSDYPIFDVIIEQGINTTQLCDGKFPLEPKYIRAILPTTCIQIEMKNHGLGMSKFLVVGMFFRDSLGNEWFKDSYGQFREVPKYKEMLMQKDVISPPYVEADFYVEDIIYKK